MLGGWWLWLVASLNKFPVRAWVRSLGRWGVFEMARHLPKKAQAITRIIPSPSLKNLGDLDKKRLLARAQFFPFEMS